MDCSGDAEEIRVLPEGKEVSKGPAVSSGSEEGLREMREGQHLHIQVAWAENPLLVNLKARSIVTTINVILIRIIGTKQSFSQVNAGGVSVVAVKKMGVCW